MVMHDNSPSLRCCSVINNIIFYGNGHILLSISFSATSMGFLLGVSFDLSFFDTHVPVCCWSFSPVERQSLSFRLMRDIFSAGPTLIEKSFSAQLYTQLWGLVHESGTILHTFYQTEAISNGMCLLTISPQGQQSPWLCRVALFEDQSFSRSDELCNSYLEMWDIVCVRSCSGVAANVSKLVNVHECVETRQLECTVCLIDVAATISSVEICQSKFFNAKHRDDPTPSWYITPPLPPPCSLIDLFDRQLNVDINRDHTQGTLQKGSLAF